MRQTKTKSDKAAKHCSLCGAKSWMFDDMRQIWVGPWHFNDCTTLPGNDELLIRNTQEQIEWESEKVVPKAMGARILNAIGKMMDKNNTPEQAAAMRVAIHQEIDKL